MSDKTPSPILMVPQGVDYKLLDSGNGRKLEQLGGVVSDRPEPQAVWAPKLPAKDWDNAVAVFAPKAGDEDGDGGNWDVADSVPDKWEVRYNNLTFYGRLTPFRHLG
ncbi:MAG: class I SAM-dependent rRNA methyltransferase, partial [Alphaproteobacteria bacterium]